MEKMVITTIFFMIVKKMYVNSSHIDITMIIIKICPSIYAHNRNSYNK